MSRKQNKLETDSNLNSFAGQGNSQKAESKNTPSSSKHGKRRCKKKTVCANDHIFLTVEDRVRLLNIFPEEVWLMIFDKLKNPEDIASAHYSSPVLREWLLPRRTLFLFPKVWDILGMKFETSKSHAYQEDQGSVEYLAELNKMPKKPKWFSGILKLRQVCKIWHDSINHFYRNLDGFYAMEHDVHVSRHPCEEYNYCPTLEHGCWPRIDCMDSRSSISDFENHFRETHQDGKSPFISNVLKIESSTNPEHLSDLHAFLLGYGAHVWHCIIGIYPNDIWTTSYQILHQVLHLMPNLITLKLRSKEYYVGNLLCNITQLKTEISRNPMPSWIHLKFLMVHGMHPLILNELLSKNLEVSMLEIVRREPDSVNNPLSCVLPNLSQLNLEILQQSEFEKLQVVNWKLTKVYLSFLKCNYIPWSQIFKLVEEKWGSTATEVMLRLPRPISDAEVQQFFKEHKSLRLSLPHIKRLKLVLDTVSTIDFILPMKKHIQILELEETYRKMDFLTTRMYEAAEFLQEIMKKKKITFNGKGCNGKINVYEILPNLKSAIRW